MLNRINIKDVDLSDLIVIKSSQLPELKRTVYYVRHNSKYIKIWEKDYFWNNFVYKGDLLNIYKDLTLTESIIYDDDDKVRGYISKAGNIVNSVKLSLKSPTKLTFDDSSVQNFKYKSLLNRLYTRMGEKEFIYLDFIPGKIAEYKGRYYFYDIEPFVMIEDLRGIHTYKKLLSYAPIEYILKANKMIKDSHSNSTSKVPLYSQF